MDPSQQNRKLIIKTQANETILETSYALNCRLKDLRNEIKPSIQNDFYFTKYGFRIQPSEEQLCVNEITFPHQNNPSQDIIILEIENQNLEIQSQTQQHVLERIYDQCQKYQVNQNKQLFKLYSPIIFDKSGSEQENQIKQLVESFISNLQTCPVEQVSNIVILMTRNLRVQELDRFPILEQLLIAISKYTYLSHLTLAVGNNQLGYNQQSLQLIGKMLSSFKDLEYLNLGLELNFIPFEQMLMLIDSLKKLKKLKHLYLDLNSNVTTEQGLQHLDTLFEQFQNLETLYLDISYPGCKGSYNFAKGFKNLMNLNEIYLELAGFGSNDFTTLFSGFNQNCKRLEIRLPPQVCTLNFSQELKQFLQKSKSLEKIAISFSNVQFNQECEIWENILTGFQKLKNKEKLKSIRLIPGKISQTEFEYFIQIILLFPHLEEIKTDIYLTDSDNLILFHSLQTLFSNLKNLKVLSFKLGCYGDCGGTNNEQLQMIRNLIGKMKNLEVIQLYLKTTEGYRNSFTEMDVFQFYDTVLKLDHISKINIDVDQGFIGNQFVTEYTDLIHQYHKYLELIAMQQIILINTIQQACEKDSINIYMIQQYLYDFYI